jgi:hypothetical protein
MKKSAPSLKLAPPAKRAMPSKLPLEAMAVCPFSEEDLAALVEQVPVCMAGELARMAAWRALGMTAPMPAGFEP